MTVLFLSLAILPIIPLLYIWGQKDRRIFDFLDGLILPALGGLFFLEFLPQSMEELGLWVLPILLAGVWLPTLLEKAFHWGTRSAHLLSISLASLGLLFHAILDGAGLEMGAHDHGHFLEVGILLHRFPLVITLWWMIRPNLGKLWALAALLFVGGGTIFGFLLGEEVHHIVLPVWWNALQVLVAGTLLHVIFHQSIHTEDEHCHHTHVETGKTFELLGNAFGIALAVALLFLDEDKATWISFVEDHLIWIGLGQLVFAWFLKGKRSYFQELYHSSSWVFAFTVLFFLGSQHSMLSVSHLLYWALLLFLGQIAAQHQRVAMLALVPWLFLFVSPWISILWLGNILFAKQNVAVRLLLVILGLGSWFVPNPISFSYSLPWLGLLVFALWMSLFFHKGCRAFFHHFASSITWHKHDH